MDFAVNYTMLMNAAVMVHSGFGAALCLNMGTDFYDDLRFVPLAPPLATGCVLAWQKEPAAGTGGRGVYQLGAFIRFGHFRQLNIGISLFKAAILNARRNAMLDEIHFRAKAA